MKIAKHTVASIHYTLTNPEGQVLDSSSGRDPLTYLHGEGNLISRPLKTLFKFVYAKNRHSCVEKICKKVDIYIENLADFYARQTNIIVST